MVYVRTYVHRRAELVCVAKPSLCKYVYVYASVVTIWQEHLFICLSWLSSVACCGMSPKTGGSSGSAGSDGPSGGVPPAGSGGRGGLTPLNASKSEFDRIVGELMRRRQLVEVRSCPCIVNLLSSCGRGRGLD